MSSASAQYEARAGLAQIEEFTVAGISIITSNKNGAATTDINALWQRFFDDDLPGQLGQGPEAPIFAVYSDYQGDHEAPYRVTIGYRIAENDTALPSNLDFVTVQQGDYGVMSAAGEQPAALLATWEAIWSSDLDRRFDTDFELYGPRFFQPGLHEVLIHIGVRS